MSTISSTTTIRRLGYVDHIIDDNYTTILCLRARARKVRETSGAWRVSGNKKIGQRPSVCMRLSNSERACHHRHWSHCTNKCLMTNLDDSFQGTSTSLQCQAPQPTSLVIQPNLGTAWFRVKELVAGRNGARGGGAGPWFRRSRCGFARIPLRFDAPAVVSREFLPLLASSGGGG